MVKQKTKTTIMQITTLAIAIAMLIITMKGAIAGNDTTKTGYIYYNNGTFEDWGTAEQLCGAQPLEFTLTNGWFNNTVAGASCTAINLTTENNTQVCIAYDTIIGSAVGGGIRASSSTGANTEEMGIEHRVNAGGDIRIWHADNGDDYIDTDQITANTTFNVSALGHPTSGTSAWTNGVYKGIADKGTADIGGIVTWMMRFDDTYSAFRNIRIWHDEDGNCTTEPTQPATSSNTTININATSMYNGSQIPEFNITILWDNTTQEDLQSSLGSIYKSYEGGEYNQSARITYKAPGHNNRTISNETIITNTSNTITYDMTPEGTYNLIIIARDSTNTTNITSATIRVNYTDEVQNNNPFAHNINNYINLTETTRTIQVNVSDNAGGHQNYSGTITITPTERTHYAVMTPNLLTLNFLQAGASHNVSGFIADEEKSRNFTNSTIIIVQSNLTNGYVHIRFNDMNNWTQYYEYIKTPTTYITETMEVITTANWFAYFRVLDYTSSPLEDVTIRGYYSLHDDPNADWTYHNLFGQRLTDENGYTFFWADSQAETYWYIYKQGYEAKELLITIGDESFTKDEALTIYLKESETTIEDNTWIYIPKNFTNRTIDITGTITAINKDKVEITTTYRTDNGLPREELTPDTLERYRFTLEAGTEFSTTGTDNIHLEIYIEETLWKNLTITYGEPPETRIDPAQPTRIIEPELLNPIIAIMIILLTSAMGILVSNKDIAPTVFKIVAILSAIISTNFIWVAVIVMIGTGLKQVRRILGE